MTEYSKMAHGRFISTGARKFINLPFQPDHVELWNITAAEDGVTDQAITYAMWDSNMAQGTAIIQGYATADLVYDNVETNGISTFACGLALQYDSSQQVVASTKANPTSFEVTGHGFSSGDVVVFSGLYSTQFTDGMAQMSGIPFTVTVTDDDNFTVPWNSTGSNYTALATSPAGATVKRVKCPYLYFPGVSFISAITSTTTLGNPTTTVSTTSAHNMVVGQEVAFRMPTVNGFPSAWGMSDLNSLPNLVIPGSPIYGYVVEVTDYNTVVVNIDSSTYAAFNVNVPIANVSGLTHPQIVAVGDVNTGAMQISPGSQLYPPPQYTPIGTTGVNTINGPAIKGAFVNNTRQGFIVGAGAGAVLTTGVVVGGAEDVIIWKAYYHDMNVIT